jgi:predicted nucleotidyltransferase
MSSPGSSPFDAIAETLRKGAAALRDAGIPFMLGGSLASWARGGPPLARDLDFMLREQDVEAALEALAGAGMRTERPPEEWLVKAWDGDVGVDVIFSPQGLPITDEVIERADVLPVLAIEVRVMALEDVLSTKLMAIDEQEAVDYTGVLQIARALREQIDWELLRERTRSSPYARAFFCLVEELGVLPGGPGPERPRVRVSTA